MKKMLEEWIKELGGTIFRSIHDNIYENFEFGHAKIGNLRLRYSWETIHIGWELEFDRWANSIDWYSDIPETKLELKMILEQAEKMGKEGKTLQGRDDFLPFKIDFKNKNDY